MNKFHIIAIYIFGVIAITALVSIALSLEDMKESLPSLDSVVSKLDSIDRTISYK